MPAKYAGLPAGRARSAGIHEANALFWEMQVARSRPFLRLILREVLRPKLLGGSAASVSVASSGAGGSSAATKTFVAGLSYSEWQRLSNALTEENLVRLSTRINPANRIRVDADECTYPAHVMVRYEIEKALFADGGKKALFEDGGKRVEKL